MNIQDYRNIIISPISSESCVGERLLDDPLYDYIDEQMMKVGSLSHSSIHWSEVENSILTLFREKTKDIKLLISLVQCLHHQVNAERLILSFFVFADYLSEFWLDGFPFPGERGKLPRRKFFTLLVQRFDLLIEKYDFSTLSLSDLEDLSIAIETWSQAVDKHELRLASVEALLAKVTIKIKNLKERQTIQSHHQIQTTGDCFQRHEEISVAPSPASSLDFDGSSAKTIKQTLIKVSEFLSEQEYGALLAIRTRRYALWSNIDFLPDHNAEGETQLRGVSPERLKEYSDSMCSPDLVLWRKVENSLNLAPYWIDGQYMSAQIARAIGMDAWEIAILDETKQFISRLPKIMDLKFKDGMPFVSEETKKWIDTHAKPQGQSVHDWQIAHEKIKQTAKEAGMSVAISMVNDGLNRAVEPRDKVYWQWLLAELLESNQLVAVANEQYRTLYEQILPMKMSDWEPSFIEKIKNKLTLSNN